MTSHILIHGADNVVGSRLGARLGSEDWASVVQVPTGDAARLAAALPGVDAVVHCVLGTAKTVENGAEILYGLIDRATVSPRVVHLGSMTVYGSAVGKVEETADLCADLGPYSEAQRRAECMARDAGRSVILRAGVEYGPGCESWSGRIARCLRQGRLGDLGAAGDGRCNLVFIDDLIAVMRQALVAESVEGESFNVASPERCSWNEYFTAYSIALGAVPVGRISRRYLDFEVRVVAPILKLGELTLPRFGIDRNSLPPPISNSLIHTCGQDIDLSAAKIDSWLKPIWTPMNGGLRAAADYYR